MSFVLSMVEDGRIDIDKFERLTVDRATYEGHFYTDKAPGLGLTAALPVASARSAMRLLGSDVATLDEYGSPTPAFDRLTRVATLATSGLLGALCVMATYVVALRLGARPPAATLAAIGLGWATPLWGWSTAFLGHATTAGLLALALMFTCLTTAEGSTPRLRATTAALAAACAAWATVVEFTALVPAVLIGAYGIASTARLPAPERKRTRTIALAVALVCGAPLLVYNGLAFGSPFRLGYAYAPAWFPEMRRGLFGIGLPRPAVLWAILFGRFRGLLWLSPLVVGSLLTLPWLRRTRVDRLTVSLLLGIPAYYLLLNAGYAYWDGGWSTGPRHVTAMLPFLMIAFGLAWDGLPAPLRSMMVGALALSAALGLVCVSTSMFAPSEYHDAWRDFLWPSFRARLGGRWVSGPDIFADVITWSWGWPRPIGLASIAVLPVLGSLFLLRRASRRQH